MRDSLTLGVEGWGVGWQGLGVVFMYAKALSDVDLHDTLCATAHREVLLCIIHVCVYVIVCTHVCVYVSTYVCRS